MSANDTMEKGRWGTRRRCKGWRKRGIVLGTLDSPMWADWVQLLYFILYIVPSGMGGESERERERRKEGGRSH